MAQKRNRGKSGHEMIQDSIMFGVSRFTFKGERLLQKADVLLGETAKILRKPVVDPKVGIEKRKERAAGRATLQFLGGWKTPVPPAAEYGTGLKTLIQHGYIEKKAKRGFKLTKKGRKQMREMEKPWFSK